MTLFRNVSVASPSRPSDSPTEVVQCGHNAPKETRIRYCLQFDAQNPTTNCSSTAEKLRQIVKSDRLAFRSRALLWCCLQEHSTKKRPARFSTPKDLQAGRPGGQLTAEPSDEAPPPYPDRSAGRA